MTNEAGLLRDLNLNPGDEIYMNCDASKEIFTVIGIDDSEAFPGHYRLNGDKVGKGLYNDKVSHKWTVASRALSFKTTGTLKEIGAKVGDVVRWEWNGEESIVCDWMFDVWDGKYTIISRAIPEGPVRTVTRKEIVGGWYGPLHVWVNPDGEVDITVNQVLSSEELDTLIQHLQEIRDAM